MFFFKHTHGAEQDSIECLEAVCLAAAAHLCWHHAVWQESMLLQQAQLAAVQQTPMSPCMFFALVLLQNMQVAASAGLRNGVHCPPLCESSEVT